MRSKDAPVDRYPITCKEDLQNIWGWLAHLAAALNFQEDAYYILCYELKKNVDLRSLSQNNMYWEWLTVMSQKFSKQGRGVYSKDDMHDLMRHKFLGYDQRYIGSTELKPVLKSTSNLSTHQMSEYLHKIDSWAADHGCLLPYPDGGDYAAYKKART